VPGVELVPGEEVPGFDESSADASRDCAAGVQYDLKKPRRFCAPADKNGEDSSAPSHPVYLVCYQTKLKKLMPAQSKFRPHDRVYQQPVRPRGDQGDRGRGSLRASGAARSSGAAEQAP